MTHRGAFIIPLRFPAEYAEAVTRSAVTQFIFPLRGIRGRIFVCFHTCTHVFFSIGLGFFFFFFLCSCATTAATQVMDQMENIWCYMSHIFISFLTSVKFFFN